MITFWEHDPHHLLIKNSIPGQQERLQPMLVLHGFADDEELLKSAANVAAAGASNLRDALRHLHSEIRFRFEEMEGHLPGQL